MKKRSQKSENRIQKTEDREQVARGSWLVVRDLFPPITSHQSRVSYFLHLTSGFFNQSAIICVLFLGVLCGTVLAANCYAADSKQIFLNANRLYEEKRFDSAIGEYETIADATQNPAVYYNLANSYFRINKIGKAILNYERAVKLSPRDEDINLNLKFAKKMVNISEPHDVIKSVRNFFTTLELFLIVFSINCLFFALLYLRFIKNIAISLTTLLVVFSVLFTSFAILCLKISDDNSPYAIVTASACEIKSGPDEEYKTELTLNEGMKLLITAQRNDWYAVKIDRCIGWANRDALERI